MRLVVLFVPVLVVLSSAIASQGYFYNFVARWWGRGWHPSLSVWRAAICTLIAVGAMSGIADLQFILGKESEALFPEKLAMMRWIQTNTAVDAAFAADMPSTSSK